MPVSNKLKKDLHLAVAVFALVLLVHGPELSGWLRGHLADRIGTSVDDVSVWNGELQLNAAHVCPPSWLSQNGGGNFRTRVFAPLNVDGLRKAWIEIPLNHGWAGSSGIGEDLLTHLPREEVTIKHIRDPLIRDGIQRPVGRDIAAIRSISAQIKLCPTPGRRSLVPDRADLFLGTLWSGPQDIGPKREQNPVGGLVPRMFISWLALFVVLWILRAKPWRRDTRRGINRKPGNTTLVDMPARLSNLMRYMPGATLARLLFSVVIVGAFVHVVYDIQLWRARSGSERVSSIAKTEGSAQIRYGPLAGTSRAVDTVVCSSDALELLEIDADFNTESVLITLVETSGKSSGNSHLAVFPIEDRNHLAVKALVRHRLIPIHAYGYEAPLKRPALLLRKSGFCKSLGKNMTGRWGLARTVFVADPRHPGQYGTELLGLIILVLLVGGAMGYAWSMFTFRRWWYRQ